MYGKDKDVEFQERSRRLQECPELDLLQLEAFVEDIRSAAAAVRTPPSYFFICSWQITVVYGGKSFGFLVLSANLSQPTPCRAAVPTALRVASNQSSKLHARFGLVT